jgi:hypothetical protein
MERASKRPPSRQLDRAWELLDPLVTLALGLAAAYAIAMGRASGRPPRCCSPPSAAYGSPSLAAALALRAPWRS